MLWMKTFCPQYSLLAPTIKVLEKMKNLVAPSHYHLLCFFKEHFVEATLLRFVNNIFIMLLSL